MTNAKRNVPLSALLGVALMAALGSWGYADHVERSKPNLGGRIAVPEPSSAKAHYADVCRIARRCAVSFYAIRWYIVDSDTLPSSVCQTSASELVGCFELGTRSLTLVKKYQDDEVLLRHELMHAALAGGATGASHDCKFFNSKNRTWWPHMGCG